MRRRGTITARGAGALLAAHLAGAQILLYIGLLLLLSLAVVIAVHLPRRTGTVERQVSTDLITVSEASHVTVGFTLRVPLVPHSLWRDALLDAIAGDPVSEHSPGPAS